MDEATLKLSLLNLLLRQHQRLRLHQHLPQRAQSPCPLQHILFQMTKHRPALRLI